MQTSLNINENTNSGNQMSNSDATTNFRYMANFENELVLKPNDILSRYFLPPDLSQKIEEPISRSLIKSSTYNLMPGIYEFIVARTIHYDNMVNALITEHPINQFVVMGAGFDSQPYRFKDLLYEKGVNVFELDLPNVQKMKISLLNNIYPNNEKLPSNVNFISTDFDCAELQELLLQAGYRPDQCTLFLWEGVTPYLSKEGVNRIIDFVCLNSASSSFLLFDFVSAGLLDGRADTYYGGQKFFEALKQSGKMMSFGIDETALDEFFSGWNVALEGYWSASDMETQYLRKADDTILGRVARFNHLAYAKTL